MGNIPNGFFFWTKRIQWEEFWDGKTVISLPFPSRRIIEQCFSPWFAKFYSAASFGLVLPLISINSGS